MQQISADHIGQGLPFLYRFRQQLPEVEMEADEDSFFDHSMQMNICSNGQPSWIAAGRAKKPYTNAFTAGHQIKSGYTPSGKWKPARSVPGKTDKRSGK